MGGIIDFLGFLGPQILEEVLDRFVLEQKQGRMNQLRTNRSPKKGFVDFPGIMNYSILDQAVNLVGHSREGNLPGRLVYDDIPEAIEAIARPLDLG